MRVLMLMANRLPYPGENGSCVHLWSLLRAWLQRNHEVVVCCYKYTGPKEWARGIHDRALAQLKTMGVQTRLIPLRKDGKPGRWQSRLGTMRQILTPRVNGMFTGCDYQAEIGPFVDQCQPDLICCYGFDAVAASSFLSSSMARMASVVDFDHWAVAQVRPYQSNGFRRVGIRALTNRLAGRNGDSIIVELLRRCEIVIEHAAHHCQWLHDHGVPQARYYPVLVMDGAGPNWESERKLVRSERQLPRILLVGKIGGANTLPGHFLFANEILPELERQLGPRGFEAHIVGGGELDHRLRAAFGRPSVRIRGYLEDLAREFKLSDVLLVPTPIEAGFRTRIAEGFSYGCTVVAHKANASGMPELQDGVNCLLGRSGRELALQVVRCLKEPELRIRLSRSARSTFERSLDGLKVGDRIVELAEEAVASRPKSTDRY